MLSYAPLMPSSELKWVLMEESAVLGDLDTQVYLILRSEDYLHMSTKQRIMRILSCAELPQTV